MKFLLVFIWSFFVLTSCNERKVDERQLLIEELDDSIADNHIRSAEMLAKIRQRAKIYKSMDLFIQNMEIKKKAIFNAKSNIELLNACRNNKLKFDQSHHYEDLSGELRTQDLELNKLYKQKTLEKMFTRAVELVSYNQELQ